jgi:ABC-type lipoprotein release transport system permease subunit
MRAPSSLIIAMIFKESVIICCYVKIFSIGVRKALQGMVINRFPTVPVAVMLDDVIRSLALGSIAGTLGSLYPGYKAARMDPARALSYN